MEGNKESNYPGHVSGTGCANGGVVLKNSALNDVGGSNVAAVSNSGFESGRVSQPGDNFITVSWSGFCRGSGFGNDS